jgi:GH15 family glucan-1,4-alpha-glucosidase
MRRGFDKRGGSFMQGYGSDEFDPSLLLMPLIAFLSVEDPRVREARALLLRRLLALQNDVGLLAEEFDTTARRQLGNFPHAFSHIGLINAALNLTQANNPAAQRAPGRNCFSRSRTIHGIARDGR